MLDDDGDGIRFGVKRDGERFVGSLRDGALAELLVVAEHASGVADVGVREFVGHGGILQRLRRGGNSLLGARDRSRLDAQSAGLHASDFVGYTPPLLQLAAEGRGE